ncbi:MAG: hypothetical protein IT210_17275 [Armatimonadetes bacterium]|nr:hypothetical protein [Armatimonadota bacterium]
MNSRELMIAVMEGKRMEAIPVAPYFWGAEYVWKLLGQTIWQVLHGPRGNSIEVLSALDRRHGCDWLVPLHHSDGWLEGKRVVCEDMTHVRFTDETTGEEWLFDKDGHYLTRPGEQRLLSNAGESVSPPLNKAEADAWLEPRVGPTDRSPVAPNRRLRERFPDRFLCGGMPAPFAGLAYSMGFEPALLLLSESPSLCAYMVEKLMGDVERMAARLSADGFDAGLMCDSWASADIMSPETYKNWIAPIHRRISDALHAAGLKSVLYNTGNLLPMLDATVAMGYDAITLEERIKGVEMEIGEVRKAVGPEVCLFGNFDSYLLQRGDRPKIREEVCRHIRGAASGPFIMGTGSPVCDATDPDTIDYWVSLVREAKRP